MSKIPLRSEIPEKYTWNLQDIFESREAWEQGYAETEKVIASFRTFEGHVAEKPVEAVKAYYELLHHLMPVMNGIECLQAIRKQHGGYNNHVPVIVLAAISRSTESAATFSSSRI